MLGVGVGEEVPLGGGGGGKVEDMMGRDERMTANTLEESDTSNLSRSLVDVKQLPVTATAADILFVIPQAARLPTRHSLIDGLFFI